MFSGAILCGSTGSGKTFTGLFFYKQKHGSKDLYVITTAKKRDEGDWEREARLAGIDHISVDSWNNIQKYKDVKHAFFIFDEQRVVGYGKWSKTFIKIAKQNLWILLSATPGDTWSDYIPVFIANGFYKNKTEFVDRHIEYNPYVNFPSIKRYHNTHILERYRSRILIEMPDKRHTTPMRKYVKVDYDKELYSLAMKHRWHPTENRPIQNASELLHILREIVADSDHRLWYIRYLIDLHERVIIFYNFNHELELLKQVCEMDGRLYFQWNGRRHDHLPEDEDRWVYLVQYSAGSEGWNCTSTNVVIFYSLNYSYRMMTQAEGRIDRLNTPYRELEYFYLLSDSPIERSIFRAIKYKKDFNERAWLRRSNLWPS